MVDPRFFRVSAPISLTRLAHEAEAEIVNGTNDQYFENVAPLLNAGPKDVSFLDNKKYVCQFGQTRAGACVIRSKMIKHAPQDTALLVTENPYVGYARVAQLFYPLKNQLSHTPNDISVSPNADIGENVSIDSGVIIQDRSEIGDNCHIGANAVIGEGCIIGADSSIGANVTLSHSIVGTRVSIFPGASIGQGGFGFAISAIGAIKVPQLGRVIIEDDVEIGANTTIDRGASPDTIIGAGTMIDNLVQIAHNVQIGQRCVIAAQVGISGSTKIGDGVVIGGQAGFAGHIDIGHGTKVAAKSGVFRNVDAGSTIGGFPAKPQRQWLREQVSIERIAKKGIKSL